MADLSSSRLSAFSSWLTALSFQFTFQFPSHLVGVGVRLARGTRYPPIVRDPESCSARCRRAATLRPPHVDGRTRRGPPVPGPAPAYCIRLENHVPVIGPGRHVIFSQPARATSGGG